MGESLQPQIDSEPHGKYAEIINQLRTDAVDIIVRADLIPESPHSDEDRAVAYEMIAQSYRVAVELGKGKTEQAKDYVTSEIQSIQLDMEQETSTTLKEIYKSRLEKYQGMLSELEAK